MNKSTQRTYHFISGLPRSGSTLLAAILRQNPRFHAGMTSPVDNLFSNMIASVSAGSELSPIVNNDQRKRLSKGIFDSYYEDLPDRVKIVFDTSRAWTAKLAAIHDLYPDAKVLCCVRNVSWIMDSMELQFRANAFEHTRFFDAAQRSTVFTRLETLANRNGLVGYAWSALNEAVYGPHARKLLIIDYDFLTALPEQVLKLVYDFLEEPQFKHDFENVSYNAQAFDENLGAAGLHNVRKKVSFQQRRSILPPELFQQYNDLNFWHDLQGSEATIVTRQSDNPEKKAPEKKAPEKVKK